MESCTSRKDVLEFEEITIGGIEVEAIAFSDLFLTEKVTGFKS